MNKLYNYYVPKGGLPQQNQKVKDRAIFKNAYLFIPREVLCDIVTKLNYLFGIKQECGYFPGQ